MSTYGPLIDDGSQTTAGENMSTSASLHGYNSSGQFLAVSINGARTVTHVQTANQHIYGILQNQPTSGQAADVGILGISKAVAGAQVTAPTALAVDSSGRLVTTNGSGLTVAYAIESAATTGVIFTVFIGPGGAVVAS